MARKNAVEAPVAVQAPRAEPVQIKAPEFKRATFKIEGTSPYVQCKFSQKAVDAMQAKMKAGSQAKKGTKREARDFDMDFIGAQHFSEEGWVGIPASSFRNACISACRIVGFKMTLGKLGLFIEAEGYDKDEGTPLIRIAGKPEKHTQHVRLATGTIDIRCRPMWHKWSASPTIVWDGDMFSSTDVTNLLMRVGMQVGLGEGRPDSRTSAGQGWGLFKVTDVEKEEKVNV